MIVGNGLIAKECLKIDNDKVLFFASGVSNSNEQRISEYRREIALFEKSIKANPDVVIVYFSTCSVLDPTLKDKTYVHFKLEMEQRILNLKRNCFIIRLPQVFGLSKNKNQLGNYLLYSILERKTLTIHKYAHRYLISNNDLSALINLVIQNGKINSIINMTFDNCTSVKEIVRMFEESLNIQSNSIFADLGSKYEIDNRQFLGLLDPNYKHQYFTEARQIVNNLVKEYKDSINALD